MAKKRIYTANKGGIFKGDSHDAPSGGIEVIVQDDNRKILVEGGEAIVNKTILKDQDEYEIKGTPKEIVSAVNSLKGTGVSFDEGATVKKLQRGGEIFDYLYHVSDSNNLSKKKGKGIHFGTLQQAESIGRELYGNDAVYYKTRLKDDWSIKNFSDAEANVIANSGSSKWDVISYDNEIEGDGKSYVIFAEDVEIERFERGGEIEGSQNLKKNGIVLRSSDGNVTVVAYNTGGQGVSSGLYNSKLIHDEVNKIDPKSADEIVVYLSHGIYDLYRDVDTKSYEDCPYVIVLNQNEVLSNSSKMEKGGEVKGSSGVVPNVVTNWDQVPSALKYVKNVSKIKFNPKPKDKGLEKLYKPFLGTDDLRPAFTGINFSNDSGISATNAHVLISLPNVDGYEGLYATDITAKKVDPSYVKDDKIDANFPNIKAVIPDHRDIKASYKFSVKKLIQYCNVAILFANKTTKQIKFRIDSENYIGFNTRLLLDCLNTALSLGYDELYINYVDYNRGVVLSKEKDYDLGKDFMTLLMPVMMMGNDDSATSDVDYGKDFKVFFDFSKNEIVNADGSIAEYKSSYSDSNILSDKEVSVIKKYINQKHSVAILDYFKINDKMLSVSDLDTEINISGVDVPNGIYSLLGVAPEKTDQEMDDFPRVPAYEHRQFSFKMNKDNFKTIIGECLDFVGKDDTIPALTGISVNASKDNIVFASTDANALIKYDGKDFVKDLSVDKDYNDEDKILSSKNLKLFLSLIEDATVTISVYKYRTKIECGRYIFSSRNVDERYPNYNGVIPESSDKEITINTKDLSEVLSSKSVLDFKKKYAKNSDHISINAVESDGGYLELHVEAHMKRDLIDKSFLTKIPYSAKNKKNSIDGGVCLLMPILSESTGVFNFHINVLKKGLSVVKSKEFTFYYTEKNRGYIIKQKDFEPSVKGIVDDVSKPQKAKELEKKIAKQESKQEDPSVQEAIESLEVLAMISKGKEKKEIEEAIEVLKLLKEDSFERGGSISDEQLFDYEEIVILDGEKYRVKRYLGDGVYSVQPLVGGIVFEADESELKRI